MHREECLLFSGHLLAVGKVCYNACYYSYRPKEAYSLVAMNAWQCSLAWWRRWMRYCLLPLFRSAQTAFVSYFVWIDKFSLSLRRKQTQTPANMAIDVLVVDLISESPIELFVNRAQANTNRSGAQRSIIELSQMLPITFIFALHVHRVDRCWINQLLYQAAVLKVEKNHKFSKSMIFLNRLLFSLGNHCYSD